MTENQLEFPIGSERKLRTAGRRERHLNGRSHWWFERIRRHIEVSQAWEVRRDDAMVVGAKSERTAWRLNL